MSELEHDDFPKPQGRPMMAEEKRKSSSEADEGDDSTEGAKPGSCPSEKGGLAMHFGVYFYPWYNETRWAEAPCREAPVRGRYDSRDPEVLRWQIDLIAEVGFDYVVFEFVPRADWCFVTIEETIERAIPLLRARGLGWSFLLDAYVLESRNQEQEEISALIRVIEEKGWKEGLVKGPSGFPLLLVFQPRVVSAAPLIQKYRNHYELRFPIYLADWDRLEPNREVLTMEPWVELLDAVAAHPGRSPYEVLAPEGFISFFESDSKTHGFDGFASVIPGYDDRLLDRDPALIPRIGPVSREGGRTLEEGLTRAVATGAEHVLLYGWNEYFEGSQIEPTETEGRRSVEICRTAIARCKNETSTVRSSSTDLQ